MTTAKTPIAYKLYENLRRMIAGLETGQRLPSEPELARKLGVSRATLREAMRTFETQGVIYRRQGSGTFVSRPPQVIQSGLEMLESIERLAERIGLPVSLGENMVSPDNASEDDALALGCQPGDKVLRVSRVILAEGHPAAYLIDVLPGDVLAPAELEKGYKGSVLDIILKRGSPVLSSSRCEIKATTASPDIARAMGIQRGDVLLCFVAYLYTIEGRVVDYSYSYFLPGHFRFHVVRRIETGYSG